MYCSSWSLVKREATRVEAVVLRCRRWTCDDCAPLRKRELIRLALRGRPTKLLTLTSKLDPAAMPDHAAQDLVRAFRKLIAHARKKHPGEDIQYLAIFESTGRGWPHLHVLLRAPYLPQRWLSAFMARELASPVVDIRQVKSRKGVSKYVAKYVAKGLGHFCGCKRYWSSGRWRKPDPSANGKPKEYTGEWSAWPVPLKDIVTFYTPWAERTWWEGGKFIAEGLPP